MNKLAKCKKTYKFLKNSFQFKLEKFNKIN